MATLDVVEHQEVLTAMAQLGGVATWAQLFDGATARQIRAAREGGVICRDERGHYATQAVNEQRRLAHQMTGVLSHASAAAYWGLNAKHEPDRPRLIVPRNRNVSAEQRKRASFTWRNVTPAERLKGVTDPLTTVIDVARTLPFDEGLAIADSALRKDVVDLAELRSTAQTVRGPGSAKVRRVLESADARAVNPLESCLRAVALNVSGLQVEPQYRIWDTDVWATVDLADERLMMAIEAEGFEAHGTRKAFEKDCARYADLASLGWVVLRFTWLKVMHSPDWVARRLQATVAARERQLFGRR